MTEASSNFGSVNLTQNISEQNDSASITDEVQEPSTEQSANILQSSPLEFGDNAVAEPLDQSTNESGLRATTEIIDHSISDFSGSADSTPTSTSIHLPLEEQVHIENGTNSQISDTTTSTESAAFVQPELSDHPSIETKLQPQSIPALAIPNEEIQPTSKSVTREPPQSPSQFQKKSSSGMLTASTTVLSALTSSASCTSSSSAKSAFGSDVGEGTTSRIALSLDTRRQPANAPALQSVLNAIEKDTQQCAAELMKVLNNTRDHVKNATTISLDYMKTMNQNAQNVHSAVDVAVDQASSFIHQVAELERELACLDELQTNLNLTKEYLTGLELYVQSL